MRQLALSLAGRGRFLASLHFEVLRKCNAAGHATVVRLIENTEMSTAVEKVVRRMGLSGLYGFDFMLEASTCHAYLIEINPRATQVGHITLGAGRDLPAALYGAVSGHPTRLHLRLQRRIRSRFSLTSGQEILRANSCERDITMCHGTHPSWFTPVSSEAESRVHGIPGQWRIEK